MAIVKGTALQPVIGSFHAEIFLLYYKIPLCTRIIALKLRTKINTKLGSPMAICLLNFFLFSFFLNKIKLYGISKQQVRKT